MRVSPPKTWTPQQTHRQSSCPRPYPANAASHDSPEACDGVDQGDGHDFVLCGGLGVGVRRSAVFATGKRIAEGSLSPAASPPAAVWL